MTQSRPPFAPKDALGEALHVVRMRGSYYCRSDLSEPWGMELPRMDGCLWLHVLTSGSCQLEVAGGESIEMRVGDLALVPHGSGHTLRSDSDAPAPLITTLPLEQIGDRYEVLHHGGGGRRATMVCCAVQLDHPAARHLIELLPGTIHIETANSPDAAWIESIVRLMGEEIAARRPGGETVITRLCDILVVQAIRSWMETDPAARSGWLSAMRDERIGAAITLIHADPGRAWSVESLARELAMSRSAFAARFTAFVGEPVMQYVSRWRMAVAAGLLAEGESTSGELADRFGYQSEAAFARAFKRITGVAPGFVKRNGLDALPQAAGAPRTI